MRKHIEDVEIALMYTADLELVLFLRENGIGIDRLLYCRQLKSIKNNKSGQLLLELFKKRCLNAKDITDVLGNSRVDTMVKKIFNFLPDESFKVFFPVLTKSKIVFNPIIKLTDFIVSVSDLSTIQIYLRNENEKKKQKDKDNATNKIKIVSSEAKEFDDYAIYYCFKIHQDGAYDLEMGIDHKFTITRREDAALYLDNRFYDKNSYSDWKLFSFPKNIKIELMWFKLPELDVPVSTDIANTSALSGCDAGTS